MELSTRCRSVFQGEIRSGRSRGSKSRVRGLQGASTRCREWERHIRYFHGSEADGGSGSRGSTFQREIGRGSSGTCMEVRQIRGIGSCGSTFQGEIRPHDLGAQGRGPSIRVWRHLTCGPTFGGGAGPSAAWWALEDDDPSAATLAAARSWPGPGVSNWNALYSFIFHLVLVPDGARP
jgi:hypothetical protein